MLKLPLKKEIILYLKGNGYISCEVIHAGQDILTITNFTQRIYTSDLEYNEILISEGPVFLDRNQVVGYEKMKDKNKGELLYIMKKSFPKEWKDELIPYLIEKNSIDHMIIKNGNIVFDSPEKAIKFEKEFGETYMKRVSEFIVSKEKNPKNYMKPGTYESVVENNIVRIRF